jgi:hypothetical protein
MSGMRGIPLMAGISIGVLLLAGCGPMPHFGIQKKAFTVPGEFGQKVREE